ncbi:hypothetical protein NON20_24435 (plasmid) [Synechocystis sp. B12]|nr:hypothetical protein NON20_24435 [Synechocystis sp. B12]
MGEWEPPSSATRINNSKNKDGLPWLLHEPDYQPYKGTKKPQNTDPFVFGEKFYYSCCYQSSSQNTLKKLGRFSVILFGSCKSSKFVLDTVFVVNRYEDIDSPETKEIFPNQMFKDVTLSKIFNSDCGQENANGGCSDFPTINSCTNEKDTYRLYEGISYSDVDSKTEMFSFFLV